MSWYENTVEFSTLAGKTLSSVHKVNDEALHFETVDGERFKLFHEQDCCESVYIESIVGDLLDLVGVPIVKAEESSSEVRPYDVPKPEYEDDSNTWTFYKLATSKGYVDIRWHGSSNGYYSESVSFVKE